MTTNNAVAQLQQRMSSSESNLYGHRSNSCCTIYVVMVIIQDNIQISPEITLPDSSTNARRNLIWKVSGMDCPCMRTKN